MKSIALEQWLEQGQRPGATLPQLLTVFTDEPLFLVQAADLYRSLARKQAQSERTVVDLDRQFDPQAFLALFAEVSLFGDVSLIEVRLTQPKMNKEQAQAITQAVQWIAQGQSPHLLLVTGPKLTKTLEKSEGFSALLAQGTQISCKQVGPENMAQWVAQTAQRKGLSMDREACTWLAENTEGNLLAAHQAIEKLALSKNGPVTLDDVQSQVSNSARYNVFDLGAAALAGDTRRVGRMIEGLQAEGEAATLVLWALQEEIRAIRDTQAAMRKGQSLMDACRQNRVWGTRQNFIGQAMKRHGADSLKTLTAWCYTAEKTIKGMQTGNPWTALEIIGLGLAGLPPPAMPAV